MDLRLLPRIARVARRPPSRRQVAVGLVAIGVVLALAAVEALWGWPEALTPTRLPR